MLDQEGLLSWYERNGISREARCVIDQIRSSNPSRQVGGGRSNVRGRYPSRKMGLTIQFESHHVELAGIYEMEHDPDVVEYYDQPPSIKLDYKSASGRQLGVMHTPDFFIIRAVGAGWEEWKTEEDLLGLSREKPNRYLLDHNGVWRCPPGESQAAQFSFYYRVRSSSQINWTYQRNIQFLEDYLRAGPSTVAPDIRRTVLAWAAATGCTSTLGDLFRATDGVASRDDIYLLVALGTIEVDLTKALLAEPDEVPLLVNRSGFKPSPQAHPTSPNLKVPLFGANVAVLQSDTGPNGMAEALRRLRFIRAYQAGEPLEEGVSGRTVRHWMQKYRHAAAAHADGLLGLLPRF